MMTTVKPLSPEWVDELVAASNEAESVHAIDAVVEFTRGKTVSVPVEVRAGRVIGPAGDDAEPSLTVPLTTTQIEAFVSGAESMSRAYTRGDFKPVGSTGTLLALLALFDDAKVRSRLAAAMGVA
jgi:hypothetical protein